MNPDFQLIETILLEPGEGEYFLLDAHLDRLRKSAGQWGFVFSEDLIRSGLAQTAAKSDGATPCRVRLLLDLSGSFSITSTPIEPPPPAPRIKLSNDRTDSADPLLYHKTTHRPLYDEATRRISNRKDIFDVIFRNNRGELTEGARTNLFLQIGESFLTPPVSAGILDGVMRQHLIRTSTIPVIERPLFPQDLLAADRIFVANSVRGLIRVALDQSPLET